MWNRVIRAKSETYQSLAAGEAYRPIFLCTFLYVSSFAAFMSRFNPSRFVLLGRILPAAVFASVAASITVYRHVEWRQKRY